MCYFSEEDKFLMELYMCRKAAQDLWYDIYIILRN